jgi:NAD(P)-dependent dehydrogenase (short-subunit alcohol dehydrogenase family)
MPLLDAQTHQSIRLKIKENRGREWTSARGKVAVSPEHRADRQGHRKSPDEGCRCDGARNGSASRSRRRTFERGARGHRRLLTWLCRCEEFGATFEAFGRIDILVNNADTSGRHVETTTPDPEQQPRDKVFGFFP